MCVNKKKLIRHRILERKRSDYGKKVGILWKFCDREFYYQSQNLHNPRSDYGRKNAIEDSITFQDSFIIRPWIMSKNM